MTTSAASKISWSRVTDGATNDVTFLVTNGYHIRKELRALGFRFERKRNRWTTLVLADDIIRVAQVEHLLRAHS